MAGVVALVLSRLLVVWCPPVGDQGQVVFLVERDFIRAWRENRP